MKLANGLPGKDGFLDSDGVTKAYVLEDTGLNRALGGPLADELFGGTGLDFLYGNGAADGIDKLYRSNGTLFESLDGGLAGDQWKKYARETNKVWYVSGSNLADEIHVDFVTEPGLLQNHHLITRLTENNGSFTFAAQIRLDFDAVDVSGNRIWNPQDVLFDLESLENRDRALAVGGLSRLLPPEGDFLAIIVDALAGNDRIIVGPTVQKTVWVDAGDGDDRVEIRSGNAILTDTTEQVIRNDQFGNASILNRQPDGTLSPISGNTSFTGLTLDNG